MKHLIYYPNCSKGGVATVIRGRAADAPESQFHCVFVNDRGGRDAFVDLPNVQVRIVARDRLDAYLAYLDGQFDYHSISLLSDPRALNSSRFVDVAKVSYELHSSNMPIVRKELHEIDPGKCGRLIVPSAYMAQRIQGDAELPDGLVVEVRPNLVDQRLFHGGEASTSFFAEGVIPLVWVGRFDKDKGVKHFVRALGLLPPEYHGYVIVSLESDPARAADFLGEVYASGVSSRVHLLMNVSQVRLSSMMREARDLGGAFVSTSLMESFGYSVVEALRCGLRVVAFELPPFAEHPDPLNLLRQVDVGDVGALAQALVSKAPVAR